MSSMVLDKEYKAWLKLADKDCSKSECQLLKVYWRLGGEMAVLKADSQWGSKFYESLSKDLKAEFPDMKGFSLQI